MRISPHDEYLTPRPTYVPDTPFEASSASAGGVTSGNAEASRLANRSTKPRFKKVLASSFAFASIGMLTATFALPAFAPAAPADDAPASKSEQHLLSAQAISSAGGLDAMGSIELGFDLSTMKQITNEAGLVDPTLLTNTKLQLPFEADWPLTDGFAYRVAPVEQFHDAQDIAASAGTPVLAIGSGIVIDAGFSSDGCGFSVKLQHLVSGDTLTSRYCHMQDGSHSLKVGDTVAMGDQVGRVGNTGLSFGPHLHLALRKNGDPIDPLPYIRSKIESSTSK